MAYVEKDLTINNSHDLPIIGKYACDDAGKHKRLVILMHGLTGDMNEFLHLNARDYFYDQGYDVYRFQFYGQEVNEQGQSRALYGNVTLETHANDMQSVIDHFRDKYGKVFVAGHSYGGLTIVRGGPKNVEAVSLWDPSYGGAERIWQKCIRDLPSGHRALDWGSGSAVLVGDIYQEGLTVTEDATTEWLKKLTVPTQVIVGGDPENWVRPYAMKYKGQLPTPNDFHVVEGADHNFRQRGKAKELYERTHQWFKKF